MSLSQSQILGVAFRIREVLRFFSNIGDEKKLWLLLEAAIDGEYGEFKLAVHMYIRPRYNNEGYMLHHNTKIGERIIQCMHIVSDEGSDFMTNAKWRKENRDWLRISQLISLGVLTSIDDMSYEERKVKLDLLKEEVEVNGKYDYKLSDLVKIQKEFGVDVFNEEFKWQNLAKL